MVEKVGHEMAMRIANVPLLSAAFNTSRDLAPLFADRIGPPCYQLILAQSFFHSRQRHERVPMASLQHEDDRLLPLDGRSG